MRTLTAVVFTEDSAFVATCPEVGTTSQGSTLEEALANLKEATELYLEQFPAVHEGRSFVTTFEVEEVADS
ncbi:MAG: type II toxin-antitoxin system HicB family antitoxin [Candidatus Thermoplasmatota archaeon]